MVHLVVGQFREGSFQQTGTEVVKEWMTCTGVIQTKEKKGKWERRPKVKDIN